MSDNAEGKRLESARKENVPWRKWGPYLSERQWGTVREDYSEDGNAWDYFSHDQARSRAYHWGEDGLAGISDDKQGLCFALAVWNGKDPIRDLTGGMQEEFLQHQVELLLDAGECAADPLLVVVLCLLRRQLQDRVSHRLGQVDEPV
jgi:hypothetical protein